MMSALTSMRSWVWLAPGDLVNVVLMNSAVRSEKSFDRSAMTFPLSPSEMSIDGGCAHRPPQPRGLAVAGLPGSPVWRTRVPVSVGGSQHHDAGGRGSGRQRLRRTRQLGDIATVDSEAADDQATAAGDE